MRKLLVIGNGVGFVWRIQTSLKQIDDLMLNRMKVYSFSVVISPLGTSCCQYQQQSKTCVSFLLFSLVGVFVTYMGRTLVRCVLDTC